MGFPDQVTDASNASIGKLGGVGLVAFALMCQRLHGRATGRGKSAASAHGAAA